MGAAAKSSTSPRLTWCADWLGRERQQAFDELQANQAWVTRRLPSEGWGRSGANRQGRVFAAMASVTRVGQFPRIRSNLWSSPGIVAATRGKHVQHFGVFQSRRLVFDIPFHDDAVTAAQVIGL